MTNGQLNALALIRTNPAPVVPSPTPQRSAARIHREPRPINPDQRVPVGGGRNRAGPVQHRLQRFSGSISRYRVAGTEKSRVELSGFVGTRAPFAVQDRFCRPQAHDPRHASRRHQRGIDPVHPYAIKFAGYPLKDGRVTAEVSTRWMADRCRGKTMSSWTGSRSAPRPRANPAGPADPAGNRPVEGQPGPDHAGCPGTRESRRSRNSALGRSSGRAIKGIFVKVATAPFKLLGSLSAEAGRRATASDHRIRRGKNKPPPPRPIASPDLSRHSTNARN